MTSAEAVMFQFFGGVTVVWAVAATLLAGNRRRLRRQIRSIATVQSRRLEARWQAGRWDADDRHAYVANLGDDTAYDVTIIDSGRVLGTAPVVPPFGAGQLSSRSSLCCYLNFCVRPADTRAALNAGSAVHVLEIAGDELHRCDIAVTVTWRAEDGTRSTQRVGAA